MSGRMASAGGNGHAALVPLDEPLWTSRDVAAFLAVSRSWVYLHAEGGTLPSVRICGLRRFIPSEIRAWALAQREAA